MCTLHQSSFHNLQWTRYNIPAQKAHGIHLSRNCGFGVGIMTPASGIDKTLISSTSWCRDCSNKGCQYLQWTYLTFSFHLEGKYHYVMPRSQLFLSSLLILFWSGLTSLGVWKINNSELNSLKKNSSSCLHDKLCSMSVVPPLLILTLLFPSLE